MRKIKLLVIVNFSMLFILILVNSNVNAFAYAKEDLNIDQTISEKIENQVSIKSIFEKNTIKTYELIYNLDDSADYFYVEFEKGGYAVFATKTMEMMEYSLQGRIPYTTSNSKKYYAGPSNYLQKSNDKFIDVSTGTQLDISTLEAKEYAEKTREALIEAKMDKFNIKENTMTDFENIMSNDDFINSSKSSIHSVPDIEDEKNLIQADDTGVFIQNANYFKIFLTIGANSDGGIYGNGNSGTCGAVAAQLLLGYNNYFNDRRIIPDKYLNGYNDDTNSVSVPELNPNYCADPMTLNMWTGGTRSEATGENSFYSKIISCIMKPNTIGASNKEIKNGIDKYLKENIPTSDYEIDYEQKGWLFGYSPISSSKIRSEIDAGRPILISMSKDLGGKDHAVVGYGYQDYTYSNNGGTYSGYVVHYGRKEDLSKVSVWINESWCNGYVSLKMNHIHDDYIYVKKIDNTGRIEYRCTSCGHRTDSAINMSPNARYEERIANLPQMNGKTYQDYYVFFKTGGNKLFQTFGSNDAKLYLYDLEYNELTSNDDAGEFLNALFNFTVESNKAYILRVKLFDPTKKGSVKIGITPSHEVYTKYEDIWNQSNMTNVSFTFSIYSNSTRIFTFNPSESGTYTIRTSYGGDTRVDTCLYVVDPTVTDLCLYDDDGAGDLQALITTELESGRTYFLVVSSYNLSVTSNNICLSISKNE